MHATSLRSSQLTLIRREFPTRRRADPAWLTCGSDLLFEALRISNVAPLELRTSVLRSGYVTVLDDARGIGGRLMAGLGAKGGISRVGFAIRLQCHGKATYSDEMGVASLTVWRQQLPEQVLQAMKGLKVSAAMGPTGITALDALDPLVRSATNGTSGDTCWTRLVLAMGWQTFAPLPDRVAKRMALSADRSIGDRS